MKIDEVIILLKPGSTEMDCNCDFIESTPQTIINMRCAAHTSQLTNEDSSPNLNKLIFKCRNFVKK